MKKILIINKLLLLLSTAALLLLLSNCASTMSQEELHAWINSQPLVEQFPYDVNVYQLDKPTAQEEKGITITPFQFKEGSYNGIELSKSSSAMNSSSFMIASTKSTGTVNTNHTLNISKKKSTSEFKNVLYSTNMELTSNSNIMGGTNTTFKMKTDKYFDVKIKNSEIVCENISTKTNTKTNLNNAENIDETSSGQIGLKDMDTDKIVTLGEPFMIAYPDKVIKIGDQWEKQVYSETTSKATSSNAKFSMTEYTIYLYTYTLTGFGNVRGQRCAIINYQADIYKFQESDGGHGGKTKEDIKKTAKTLSKSTTKSIQEYMSAKNNQTAFSGSHQFSAKLEGIVACDYQTGLIVDSHFGQYSFAGIGTARGGMTFVATTKAQSVFHLKE